jgi:hypothetical protein
MATKPSTAGCPHARKWTSGSLFWCSVPKLERRCCLSFYEFAYLITLHSVSTFGVLSSQYFSPHGYSEDVSGFIGATLLLSGIVASAITSPIFDRVLTKHLALTVKVFVPTLSAAWLSMIWAGRSFGFSRFAYDILT